MTLSKAVSRREIDHFLMLYGISFATVAKLADVLELRLASL
jgi:hypothetical protein